MQTCSHCAVRESAICHSLSLEKLVELRRSGRRQTLHAGQTLSWEGDEAKLVGNVIDGVLKLSLAAPEGRDQTLGIVYPGDFIGRAFGATCDHTVTAVTDSQVCTFRQSTFDALARDDPALEHELLERTLIELNRARKWMLMLGRMNAAQRVSSFLIEMASRLCRESASDLNGARFTLPFGRQEIGDFLGLTIETVSRQFTMLRKSATVEIPDRRSIIIRDWHALQAIASGD